MKQTNENIISAWDAVLLYLQKNNTQWIGFLPLDRAVTELMDIRKQVGEKMQVQSTKSEGLTTVKDNLRRKLEQEMLAIARPAHAYALEVNNPVLAVNTDMGASLLSKAADTVIAEMGTKLVKDVADYMGPLKEFRVEQMRLDTIGKTIKDYQQHIGSPVTVIAGTKTATASLFELVRMGQNLMKKRMDKLIRTFEDEDADFVNDYFNARIIRDLGRRKEGGDEPKTNEDKSTMNS